jgi:hypothetical protein
MMKYFNFPFIFHYLLPETFTSIKSTTSPTLVPEVFFFFFLIRGSHLINNEKKKALIGNFWFGEGAGGRGWGLGNYQNNSCITEKSEKAAKKKKRKSCKADNIKETYGTNRTKILARPRPDADHEKHSYSKTLPTPIPLALLRRSL